MQSLSKASNDVALGDRVSARFKTMADGITSAEAKSSLSKYGEILAPVLDNTGFVFRDISDRTGFATAVTPGNNQILIAFGDYVSRAVNYFSFIPVHGTKGFIVIGATLTELRSLEDSIRRIDESNM